VTTPNGDFEQLATSASAGNTGIENAVELQPGQSATVNVTFTATDPVGTTDYGTLYLDSLQSGVPAYGQLAADEAAALPYAFTADISDQCPTCVARG
jgi:hypothetical protein